MQKFLEKINKNLFGLMKFTLFKISKDLVILNNDIIFIFICNKYISKFIISQHPYLEMIYFNYKNILIFKPKCLINKIRNINK